MIRHWTIASSICCFAALAVFGASFSSSDFSEYIYNYEANIFLGSSDLKITAKAHLELLHATTTVTTNTGNKDSPGGHLFRLRLTEPVLHSSKSKDQPLEALNIDTRNKANLYNHEDLYAHIVTLTNGTAYIKGLYTHKLDSEFFKNIKKSILLNLLPTSHHLKYIKSINTQQETDTLFIDDNNLAQPELFSPDSISSTRILATLKSNLPLTSNLQQVESNSIELDNLEDKQEQYSSKLPVFFDSVQGYQNVTFGSRVYSEAQSNLTTNFNLKLVHLIEIKSNEHEKFKKVVEIKTALDMLPDKGKYEADSLELKRQPKVCTHHHCHRSLPELFQDYEKDLTEESMASVETSVAFLRLLEKLRMSQGSSAKEILKILKKTKRNQGIESSVLDILAAARTKDSITAAIKFIKFPKNTNLDISERFLSVLQVAAITASKMQLRRPLMSPYYFTKGSALKRSIALREQESRLASIEFIAQELLQIIKSTPADKWASQKLRWSTLLTLAALVNANIIDNELDYDYSNSLNEKVSKLLLEELKSCHEEDVDCRIVLLQAIGNVGILNGNDQFKALREQVLNSGRRESISAMRVLKDLLENQPKDKPPKDFDYVQLKDLLLRVVYDSQVETTARALAAEMIVRFVPSHLALKEILINLPSFENNELATMIYTRMQSLKPDSLELYNDNWYWKACVINGTSKSFVKTMAQTDVLNVSYGLNVELMNNGKFLKESAFNVFLDTKKRTQDLFSLGIFARGLSNLPLAGGGNGAESTAEDKNETPTAGMSLRLLGGYLRPNVFFNGAGELMSHYWRGTAKKPTSAFMGNMLLIDHDEGYPLISGFVAEQQMRGVLSIDVSGQVDPSIWQLTVDANVRTKATVIVQASQSIYTGNDKLWQAHLFSFGGQALVDFVVNINGGATPMKYCLQVTQPEFKVRMNTRYRRQLMTNDIERRLIRKDYPIGAKSYPLNTEINKMCSLMSDEL